MYFRFTAAITLGYFGKSFTIEKIGMTYYMDVSENRDAPKWMVYQWKTLLKWMIWWVPLFSETSISEQAETKMLALASLQKKGSESTRERPSWCENMITLGDIRSEC